MIEVLESKVNSNKCGTDQWHTDITFVRNPPTATVLYGVVIPPTGGDTIWSSSTAVNVSLSPSLWAYLEELEVTHSFEHSGWPPYFARLADGEALYRKAGTDYAPLAHPVIRTHPVTGKKVVYVSPNSPIRSGGCRV